MWRWLTLALLSPVAWGMGDYAATIHNSEWTHSGSNTLCTLAHDITGYGVGRFELRPGRRLTFVVETLQPGKGEGEAQVTIRPPPWIHDAEARAPVAVKLGRGKRPLVIEGALGEQLLDALKRGWSAQIEHAGRSGAPVRVRASLNPVNFQKGFRDYLACSEKLLPYSFDEARRNTLRFKSGKYALSDSMKGVLDRVVAFVRASGEQRYRIYIGGHTDNVARHVTNNRLAARRIASVADYLVKNGISSSMLSKKNHGESRPVASNRSERGRALNRRVEIRLVKSK